MRELIVLYILISTFSTFGQNIQFVKAPNGLIIRNDANKTSKRIGKLQYGDRVDIINITDKPISVLDEGVAINGFWTEINQGKHNPKGYVFNGFLSPKALNKGKETPNFYLTAIPESIIKNFWYNMSNSKETKPGRIYLRNNKNENLYDFLISDLEMYDNTSLYERKVKKLQNIKNVIVVENNFSACCSNYNSTYLLQTDTEELIALPEISNVHCDGPEPYFDYIFPNETGGKHDIILYAKITPKNENTSENIEVLKTFSWNGKNLTEK